MEWTYRIALLLAGIINLLPATLAFLPQRIQKTYGVAVPDANYALLLRHRAVLFGIVGGLLIYSAVTQKNCTLSFVVGLVSMASFIVLYGLAGPGVNPELRRVMQIDVVATVVLMLGFAAYKWGTA